MMPRRLRPIALAALVSTSLLAACGGVSRKGTIAQRFATRPIAVKQLAVLPVQVTLGGGSTVDIGTRRTAIGQELQAAVADELQGRGKPIAGDPTRGPGMVRIQHAFQRSSVYVHREMVGRSAPARRSLPEGEVRAIAEAAGADALLVTQLVGNEVSTGEQIAQSATAVAGAAAMGVITMSPIRILGAAMKVGETARASELRVALVDGASGEILWANYVFEKRVPTPAVVQDLVAQAFATFPPAEAELPRLSSAR